MQVLHSDEHGRPDPETVCDYLQLAYDYIAESKMKNRTRYAGQPALQPSKQCRKLVKQKLN